MTRYKARKALSNEGLTVREIPHDDGDGFIIRVMNRPSGVANEARRGEHYRTDYN